MANYLKEYISSVDDILSNKKINNSVVEEHLVRIQFFQHERLIHLLVTLFYALLTIVFFALGTLHWSFLVIAFILIIFLVFYIIHYFKLENGVQYLYRQYEDMLIILK